jgi:hypothetical protein
MNLEFRKDKQIHFSLKVRNEVTDFGSHLTFSLSTFRAPYNSEFISF